MKTAISVPDDLFRKAEGAARRLRMSRSQLYSTALSEYLQRQSDAEITRRLNEVYATEPSALDPGFVAAQVRSIPPENW